jgi:hypothetical protein
MGDVFLIVPLESVVLKNHEAYMHVLIFGFSFLSADTENLQNPTMSFSEMPHPLSYNMHLGHGILSAKLRSNTFDDDDVEQSNRIIESDLSWLFVEEHNSSTKQSSIECSNISNASAALGLRFDILNLT